MLNVPCGVWHVPHACASVLLTYVRTSRSKKVRSHVDFQHGRAVDMRWTHAKCMVRAVDMSMRSEFDMDVRWTCSGRAWTCVDVRSFSSLSFKAKSTLRLSSNRRNMFPAPPTRVSLSRLFLICGSFIFTCISRCFFDLLPDRLVIAHCVLVCSSLDLAHLGRSHQVSRSSTFAGSRCCV